jgi:hypothetical protein
VKQFMVNPSAGKRLIAKALASHAAVSNALKNGTVVIVAGTTNGYVAEEIFKALGNSADFSRLERFLRKERWTEMPRFTCELEKEKRKGQ